MMAGQNGYYEKPWIKNFPMKLYGERDKVGFEPPQKQWMAECNNAGLYAGSKKKTGEKRHI